jgi:hypothetical protein
VGCEQKLEELGLLEELDAAIHPSLMKKQTSLFSRRSSEGMEEEIKFCKYGLMQSMTVRLRCGSYLRLCLSR